MPLNQGDINEHNARITAQIGALAMECDEIAIRRTQEKRRYNTPEEQKKFDKIPSEISDLTKQYIHPFNN